MKNQKPSDQELREYAADTARDLVDSLLEYEHVFLVIAALWGADASDERVPEMQEVLTRAGVRFGDSLILRAVHFEDFDVGGWCTGSLHDLCAIAPFLREVAMSMATLRVIARRGAGHRVPARPPQDVWVTVDETVALWMKKYARNQDFDRLLAAVSPAA